MLFIFLSLVHLCAAFPLKCPEPAQWSIRARSHCPDPTKYFCLKNDLIDGYSENCTVFDFLQPGRKNILRGGLDADVCSLERYQPWPIKFYTNVSTNCIFFKSTCNEEGQVVYNNGDRNTDTACRCDYSRGYSFLVNPQNPCFCVPSKEDCSCYQKTCLKSTDMVSPDYVCLQEENNITVSKCKPIIINRVNTVGNKNTTTIVVIEYMSKKVDKILITAVFFGAMIVFAMAILTDKLLTRYCRPVFFVYEPLHNMIVVEGKHVELKYKLSTDKCWTLFIKDGRFLPETQNVRKISDGSCHKLEIADVTENDAGVYSLRAHFKESKRITLRIQPMFTEKIEPRVYIEGDTIQLICSVYDEAITVKWYKEEHDELCGRSFPKSYEQQRILSIVQSTVSDSGMYIVEAENVQMKFQVTVRALLRRPLQNVTIMEGLDTVLECETEEGGCPVQWLKDGEDISYQSERIKAEGRLHSLTILNTSRKDSGLYTIKINEHTSDAVLSVKEMPATILQMSVQEREEFLKAAKSGTTKRFNFRVMIVGEKKVGKTCLLRRLMNEEINDVESTDGINIVRKKCKIDIQSGEWHFSTGEVETPKIKKKNKSAKKRTKSQKRKGQELKPFLFGKGKEFADCGFWDFAGQEEFYATHQTFLSTNAVYLLVVDVSRDFETKTFDNMIENEFKNVGEYIDFWLDTIHCYSTNDKNASSQCTKNDLIHPPVIIVGTGVDKIPELKREAQTRHFQEHLNEDLYDSEKRRHLRKIKFLSNMYPTDNKQEFKTLRENIFSEAITLSNWGDHLPTRWIVLEKEIYRKRKSHVITYNEAKSLAIECSFPDVEQTTSELDSFLTYEHDIGNIIFFKDVNSFIVLDQEWLANVFRCFVSHKYKDGLIGMPEWGILAKTGMLKENLINTLLQKFSSLSSAEHKEFVLKLMEKFDIIVRPKNYDYKNDFYMPCMIKAKTFETIFENSPVGAKDYKQSSWFCLEFNFLPPSYFNHILVSFMKSNTLFWDKKDKELSICRNIGKFQLNETGSRILFICLGKNVIAMQVREFNCNELSCNSAVKNRLIDLVDSIKLRYRININYEKRFKCADAHFCENESIGYDEVVQTSGFNCSKHNIMHSSKEMYNSWLKEEEVEKERQNKGRTKCHNCKNMSMCWCYDCCKFFCIYCAREHCDITEPQIHSMQPVSDIYLLHTKFRLHEEEPMKINDIKCFPNGLLVAITGDSSINKCMTFSLSGTQKQLAPCLNEPFRIAVMDKNTIAASVKAKFVSVANIQERYIIENMNNKTIAQNPDLPFLYIDNHLYVASSAGITVSDLLGDVTKCIELGFTPLDMCYDVYSQRIYCIDSKNEKKSKLICIDRDGNNIFTFTDSDLTSYYSLTTDNEKNVLVLCNTNSEKMDLVMKVDSNGKSSEHIITKITLPLSNSNKCICFHHLTNEVVIGSEDTVYIYKKEKDFNV